MCVHVYICMYVCMHVSIDMYVYMLGGSTPEVMSWTRPCRTEGLISLASLVANASSDIILSCPHQVPHQ